MSTENSELQTRRAAHPALSKWAVATMALLVPLALALYAQVVRDPGVRGGQVDSGAPLTRLSASQAQFFTKAKAVFQEIDSVGGTIGGEPGNGLGPRFNLNQCSGCHSQPAVGGTSPRADQFPFVGPNPETLVFNLDGALNTLPGFIDPAGTGPVVEARFKFFLNPDGTLSNNPDGGVHDLFTIRGRTDAGTCGILQPDFATHLKLGNVIFRIPTPTFGGGLIENIDDATIINNMNDPATAATKQGLGISGHPNRNGNDGTITRFGWKAQNKSLLIFAGEAYNVEQGVSNELFQTERPSPDEDKLPPECKLNPTPEDHTEFGALTLVEVPSDVVHFANFMRFLAAPRPVSNPGAIASLGGLAAISNGGNVFNQIGCNLCHTPTLMTSASSLTPDLDNQPANLFSDLLVHHMGTNLADGVSQGNAGPDEFRTAPLWGVGQRIFFLHDGRTRDLLNAIQQHASPGSEANGVIANFNALQPSDQQLVLNFLRSL